MSLHTKSVTVAAAHEPETAVPTATKGWLAPFVEVVKYRYLLQNLIIRDLKVRYKNSLLGVLWSLLNPLMMMLVFTLVFTVLMPNDIPNFPVFLLVALLPWQFFTGSLLTGVGSVTSNAALIKKVYFPRLILPLAAVLSNLVNFLLAFIVLVLFLYISGVGLTRYALWLPAILMTQFIFILGLCLLLSAIHVFYRDMGMILDVVLLAWFFLTPIFYPFEWLAGEPRTLLGITFEPVVVMRWLNPMASIVDGYRTVLWGTQGSNGPAAMAPIYLLRTFITAVVIFVAGFAFFVRTEHLYGEKV